jgi:hypothetical protein
MTSIKRILGTAIGFLMVLAFTGTIATIVLSLAVPDRTALHKAWAELRCIAGYPVAGSVCAQDLIRDANEATNAAKRQTTIAEVAQQAAQDALASGDLEFTQGPLLKDGVSIVVGTIYRDAINRTGLVRSFCWAIVDSGGLDPRVGLAVLNSTGQVIALDLTNEDLTLLELDENAIAAALVSCPWPGAVN